MKKGGESLQVEAEDAIISVGIIFIAVDHDILLLRVGDLVVVISLEGPVLVGGLGEGGVQGVEVTVRRGWSWSLAPGRTLVVVSGDTMWRRREL